MAKAGGYERYYETMMTAKNMIGSRPAFIPHSI